MGDVVNLRQVRKRRARDAAERAASDNRVKFGTPKALREAAKAERDRAAHRLDGARREPPDPAAPDEA
ncbi:DUF4169 family protein [Jiella sp. M17.18]|uniref:DUF4169 family protein n=1 Tax=Jiella sp. M17.18 TaxID=3234247 RepID=UPI0034DFD1F9